MDKPIIITHNGPFHTDDVFAVAVIDTLLDGEYELIRTRDPEIIKTGDYVIDVGGEYSPEKNLFDHHQEGGAGKRIDGVQYSSFGLVWKKFGEKLSKSKEVASIIDKRLGFPIDAVDNGTETFITTMDDVFPYLVHNVISSFRPTWKEERSHDVGFHDALVFAKRVLEREILHAYHEILGKEIVKEAYTNANNKRIIVIDNNYPWEEVLNQYPEPLYVVKPRKDSTWQVKTVRVKAHSFVNRKNLPFAWAGKKGEELAQITGVSDAIFCHNKLFTAGARSKEGALKLAQLAVDA